MFGGYADITSAEKAADQTAMASYNLHATQKENLGKIRNSALAARENTNAVQQHFVPRGSYKHQTGWLCIKSPGCSSIKSLARLISVCPTFIL